MHMLCCSCCFRNCVCTAKSLHCCLPHQHTAAADVSCTIFTMLLTRLHEHMLQGRLRALEKKLKGITTLVFIDAPYVLPLWYKPSTEAEPSTTPAEQSQPALQDSPRPQQQQQPAHGLISDPGPAVSCLAVLQPGPLQQPKIRPHELPQQQCAAVHGTAGRPAVRLPASTNKGCPAADVPAAVPKPRRAWLLSRELLAAQPELQAVFAQMPAQQGDDLDSAQNRCSESVGQPEHMAQQGGNTPKHSTAGCAAGHTVVPGLQQQHAQASACTAGSRQQQRRQEQQSALWLPAPAHVANQEQYTTQALGWDASWQVIQAALLAGPGQQQNQVELQHMQPHQLQQLPPVDGILGFSQGAAVAAVVAALCQQQQALCAQLSCQDASMDQGASASQLQLPQLNFVIIASGFPSPAPEHTTLLDKQRPIALPSLHIFAAASEGGSDRQIQQDMSERLLEMFDAGSRRVVTHPGGHMIPTDAASVGQIRDFLQQFL